MAASNPNFSPLKELKERRRAEAARKERLAPRKMPEMKGGLRSRGGKMTAASATRLANRELNWTREEGKRQEGVEKQLYSEEAEAKKARMKAGADIAGRLAEQQLRGQQQVGLESMRGEQAMGLERLRGAQSAKLAGMKSQAAGRGKGTEFGPKQQADVQAKLFDQYYGKGKGGSALRKQYEPSGGGLFGGEKVDPGGYQRYLKEQMAEYGAQTPGLQPQQQQQVPQDQATVPMYQDQTGAWTNLPRAAGALPQPTPSPVAAQPQQGAGIDAYVQGLTGGPAAQPPGIQPQPAALPQLVPQQGRGRDSAGAGFFQQGAGLDYGSPVSAIGGGGSASLPGMLRAGGQSVLRGGRSAARIFDPNYTGGTQRDPRMVPMRSGY